MNFSGDIWNEERLKEIIVFLIIVLCIYILRRITDLILLTFLFTYLIYSAEKFLINRLKIFIKIDKLYVTIFVYSGIFIVLGYTIYRFVPIIVSQSIMIINQITGAQAQEGISRIEAYLYPIIGNIDIQGDIKNGANSIFEFVTNIGKWGINILLSLVLSLFFMLEKDKIKDFFKKIKTSKIAGIYKYMAIFCNNFFNSFGKVMQAQVLIAFTNSILSTIALSIMGFPELIALAFMIFIFSIIPVAGTIMSLIPLSIISFNIGGFIKVIYVWIVIALLHVLESYFLNPQFMSAKTQLPVFLVFIILIISQKFMGMWGMLIGIPLFMFILDVLGVNLNEK